MTKIFKYRVSESENVKPTTHNEVDFPLESIRLDWSWRLLFQHALMGIIKKRFIEQPDLFNRLSVLCESMRTSDEPGWIEIECTQEEIDLIEECAENDWLETLNRHNILKEKKFPAHLAHMKDALTKPDAEHLAYLKSHYDAYRLIVATRKEKLP